MRKLRIGWLQVLAACAWVVPAGCGNTEESAVPSWPVSINLGSPGVWQTYGVTEFGGERRFIAGNGLREPSGYPWSGGDATGYGGVLLTQGADPFAGNVTCPLAYDLSCPVEGRRDVRVSLDKANFEAVCPACGSRYDVVTGAGTAVSGPAKEGGRGKALRRYKCTPSGTGGYIITN